MGSDTRFKQLWFKQDRQISLKAMIFDSEKLNIFVKVEFNDLTWHPYCFSRFLPQ